MPVTVVFDPTVGSKQSQVIPNATPHNDGVMSEEQAAELAALVVADFIEYDAPDPAVVPTKAVYLSGADTVDLADALTSLTVLPFAGIVTSNPAVGRARVATSGEVAGFAGLVAKDAYYLSAATPGEITNVAPAATGEVVQMIGWAKNATTLVLEIGVPVVRA